MMMIRGRLYFIFKELEFIEKWLNKAFYQNLITVLNMLEIFSSRLSNLGLVVHHKGSWEIHLLSMPRHSLGLYSGAVWPAPCKKPNSITSYFIKLQQATSNIIRNIGTLTFTVANVKLFPYSFVYLHTNFKKQSIIIENKIKI